MNAVALRFAPWRAYWLEARCEFLRVLRTPSFALPTLLFPPLFYLLFGVLLASRGGSANDMAQYMLATYGVFGVMGVALFGFGVNVALDRQRGLLALKRALPMPAGAYIGAKMASAMLFAVICSLSLAVLAIAFAGVVLTPAQWALLFVVNVLGVLPFSAIGLWLGSLVGGDGAPAVVNMVYLPMSFLSGLWIPLAVLPAFIAKAAPLWPAYHLGQIALKVVGKDAGGSLWLHLSVLFAITVAFSLLARRRLSRVG